MKPDSGWWLSPYTANVMMYSKHVLEMIWVLEDRNVSSILLVCRSDLLDIQQKLHSFSPSFLALGIERYVSGSNVFRVLFTMGLNPLPWISVLLQLAFDNPKRPQIGKFLNSILTNIRSDGLTSSRNSDSYHNLLTAPTTRYCFTLQAPQR